MSAFCKPGQEVAQGRRVDDHPPLQHLHEHHGDQGQALHGRIASRHPPHRRYRHRVTAIDKPAARNWLLDVTSTNPMGFANQEFIDRAALDHQRARVNTIPVTRSPPAQSARRSANTTSTTPSARQARDDGRARALLLTYSINDAYVRHRLELQPCRVADRHESGP